jgi:hypothetical protein
MVIHQKGYLDMAGGPARIHELAEAVRRYPDVPPHLGVLPPGALPREIPGIRAGRPYPPTQRVSWLAELLPFLGPEQASLYGQINRQKSWNDPENGPIAATLIPQFLNPEFPPSSWWVRYGSMKEETAVTHYVGIAGVGLDAAEYAQDDPAVASKIGVFGYDRATRLREDIPDGAANTIAVAQVPPTFKRPWLAGGGSTVMGVPEKGSIKPFVATNHDGKRGGMFIMADGSVRFIREDVSDDVFKALCTAKGKENVIVNSVAPRVEPPEGTPELRTTEPPTPVPAQPPAPPAASAPGEWKEFASKDGGYSVLLPTANPKENKVAAAGMETVVVQAELPAGQGAYMVIHADLPPAVTQQPNFADLMWENVPKQVEANVPGAKITGEPKKITLGEHSGRELVLELPNKSLMNVHAYLVKARIYQVIAVGSKEMLSSKESQKFFDSFKLVK